MCGGTDDVSVDGCSFAHAYVETFWWTYNSHSYTGSYCTSYAGTYMDSYFTTECKSGGRDLRSHCFSVGGFG